MNTADPLAALNPLRQPEPVAWWPPAPGWYVVLAALLILSVVFAFRWLKAWRRDTYRRQAVRELAAIRAQGRAAARQLPLLLKRTALAAWPRQRVAVLSGAQWHAFLDSTAGTDRFGREAGALLDRLAYAGRGEPGVSDEEFARVCALAESWIRKHRAEGD